MKAHTVIASLSAKKKALRDWGLAPRIVWHAHILFRQKGELLGPRHILPLLGIASGAVAPPAGLASGHRV